MQECDRLKNTLGRAIKYIPLQVPSAFSSVRNYMVVLFLVQPPLLCHALPCPASLAASWCKALVQEIATSLQLGGNAGGAQWADAPIIASASLLSNNMHRFLEAIWIHVVHCTWLVTVTSLLGIVHQVSGEIIEILSLFWKFNFLFKDRVLVQIGLDT